MKEIRKYKTVERFLMFQVFVKDSSRRFRIEPFRDRIRNRLSFALLGATFPFLVGSIGEMATSGRERADRSSSSTSDEQTIPTTTNLNTATKTITTISLCPYRTKIRWLP